MQKQTLMPIGRFSKACRLSVKALRYYDEQGLLAPSYIDPVTKYRYYERHQARQAVMISMLRSLDLPLVSIKALLQADAAGVRNLLEEERQRLSTELVQKQRALNSIARLTDAGQLLPYEVNIRDEPDHTVVCLIGETDADHLVDDSTHLIETLYQELQQSGREYAAPVMCITEDPDSQERITIHACIGVVAPFPTMQSASIKTIKGGSMACLNHYGAYEELGLAYHALLAWAQERGHEQSGAMREIYLNDPSETPQDLLKTEVLLPLKLNNY